MQIFPDVAFVSLAMLQVALGLLGWKAPSDASSSQMPPSTASANAQGFRWQTRFPLLWKVPRVGSSQGKAVYEGGGTLSPSPSWLFSSHLWGVHAPASKAPETHDHLPGAHCKADNKWLVNELNE